MEALTHLPCPRRCSSASAEAAPPKVQVLPGTAWTAGTPPCYTDAAQAEITHPWSDLGCARAQTFTSTTVGLEVFPKALAELAGCWSWLQGQPACLSSSALGGGLGAGDADLPHASGALRALRAGSHVSSSKYVVGDPRGPSDEVQHSLGFPGETGLG